MVTWSLEDIEVRKLLELVSGDVNFKILRILHDKPMYSGDLSGRLNVNIKTIRVHLHRLRENNFVDFEKDGRRHIYSILIPFETPVHELIMALVAMADPIKKRGEDDEPIPVETIESNRLRDAQAEYWTTLLSGIVENFFKHGSFAHQKQLDQQLDKIKDRIQRLKDK
jgi:DNA-binding transcriptional ArsR family regulator